MATRRIKDITNTATTFASDDFIALDGATQGTRKMDKDDLIAEVSAGVSGDYLEEANNLSDVASLDTSKLNMEIPDVGTAPNEVPLNGMLGDMAYQSSDGVSAGTVEAESLTVDSGGSTQPTQSVVTNDGAEGSALELRNNSITSSTATALRFTNSTAAGSNYGAAKISAVRTDSGFSGNTDIVISSSTSGSLTEKVRIDSSGRVGIGTASPQEIIHAKAADPAIRLEDTSAGGSAEIEALNGSLIIGSDIANQVANSIIAFKVDGVEGWRINASGNLVANSTGIDFGSVAGGSGTPITNGGLLDDYEAGSFVPQVADATSGGNVGSAATALGTYTKVGRVVHFEITLADIDTTGMTSGNTFYIRNLPFVQSSGGTFAQLTAKTDNVTFNDGIVGSVVGGQNNAYLVSLRSANTDVNRQVAHITSGTADVYLSGSYIAA